MKPCILWAMSALAAIVLALTAGMATASPAVIVGECTLTNRVTEGDQDYGASGVAQLTNLKLIKTYQGLKGYQADVTVTCSGLTAGATYAVTCSSDQTYYEGFSVTVEVTADGLGNVRSTLSVSPVLAYQRKWSAVQVDVERIDKGEWFDTRVSVLYGEVRPKK
jgi:hypothetical protein